MVTSTNKISNVTTNLVVDSTSHLPEIINVPSSPSIIETTTTTTTNNSIQQLSSNELINNENVCSKNFFYFKRKFFYVFFLKAQSNSSSSHSPQSTSTITSNGTSSTNGSTSSGAIQKRLHVSNIPFRFRDDDLKAMFEVSKNGKRNKNVTFISFLAIWRNY